MTRPRPTALPVPGMSGLAVPTVLLLAFLACYYVVGPRISAKGGLGFDGRIYSSFAQDFFAHLEKGEALDHYANRLLPSLIIFAATRSSGISLETSADVYTAFFIFNGVLLLLGLYLWRRISVFLAFDPWVYLLGVCGLILNCQTLKMTPYYPMLTDTSAWFLGLASVYSYLKGRQLLLLLCLASAYFTWPIACGFILLLLAFPSPIEPMVPLARATRILLIAGGLLVAACAYSYVAAYDGKLGEPVFLVSATIALTYLGYILWSTVTQEPLVSPRSLNVQMITAGLLLLALLTLARRGIVNAYGLKPMQFSLESYIAACLRRSSAQPGAFVLSHVSYFGPAFLLAVMFLRKALKSCAQHGAGLCYSLLAVLGFALDSESRHLTFSYPLIALSVCLLVRDMKEKARFLLFFAIASVIGTKLYLPLNIAASDFKPHDIFPAQWFFMNYGPWLSWEGYAMTLGITAVMTILIAVGIRRLRPQL